MMFTEKAPFMKTLLVPHLSAVLAALAALLIFLPSAQAQTPHPAITISNPWVRPTPPGTTLTAFYADISLPDNTQGDRLLGAFSDIAKVGEVHEVVQQSGTMVMRPVQGGVAVPGKGSVSLKPGSYHVMLIGLKQPIAPGDTVTVLLWFERAGTVTVQATAQDAAPMGGMSHGAQMPMQHGAPGMQHGGSAMPVKSGSGG